MNFGGFIDKNYQKKDMIAKMNINSNGNNVVYTYHYSAEALANQSIAVNTYMSMNPMKFINKKINRDKKHVSRLKWLYMDLDTYKSLYHKLSNEQIVGLLEADHFGIDVPYPTYVIDSGRGMYLLWKIDENILAEPRWINVQEYLHSRLIEYGSDRAVVTDTARVLRCVGSINSKSGKEVQIIRNYEKEYTLYEIMRDYIPFSQWKTNKRNYKNVKRNTVHKKNKFGNGNKILFLNNSFSLASARLKDLEILLLTYRDYPGSYREYILFLYRYYSLVVMGDKQLALDATIELNQRMKNPLSKVEVIKATKSAEKYYSENGLKIKNETIIENLKITPDEMKSLRTIISSDEKILRKKIRNKKSYLNKILSLNKMPKSEDIKIRHLKEIELLKAGKTQKEICIQLNISKSTFYNDKKVIDNQEYCKEEASNISPEKSEALLSEPIIVQKNRSPKNSAPVLREDVVLISPSVLCATSDLSLDYISGDVGWWDCVDAYKWCNSS